MPGLLMKHVVTLKGFELMEYSQKIIDQTKKWINEVVIGCNFCPFAAKVISQNRVNYRVEEDMTIDQSLTVLTDEMQKLDQDNNIETSFLIFSNSFNDFNDYLKLVDQAEKLIKKNGHEGIYQVASFHPRYQFTGSSENDAANFTNRSIYPMLHLLREKSIEKALELFQSPENIPDNNINFAREKGPAYMKMLRDSCLII